MRKILSIFLTLLFTFSISVNAQTVIGRMATLISNASTNTSVAVDEWETSQTGGAIRLFNGSSQFIGGITNGDAVTAFQGGTKYLTVAMWIYGKPTNETKNCVFGYGGADDGFKLQITNTQMSVTTKGKKDFDAITFSGLEDNTWNMIAFTLPGTGRTSESHGRIYYTATNGSYRQMDNMNLNKSDRYTTPATANQKFAIGSGNQGDWREGYKGIIANVTLIESDNLLDNSAIKNLLGDAPTATSVDPQDKLNKVITDAEELLWNINVLTSSEVSALKSALLRAKLAKGNFSIYRNELTTAMNAVRNNPFGYNDGNQYYRVYQPLNKQYLTVTNVNSNPEASHASDCLTIQDLDNAKSQLFQFTVSNSENKFYISSVNDNGKRITVYANETGMFWNPSMTDNGSLFWLENTTYDLYSASVYFLKSARGTFGANSSEKNEAIYTNKETGDYLKWTFLPVLSVAAAKEKLTAVTNEAKAFLDNISSKSGEHIAAYQTAYQNASAALSGSDLTTDEYKTYYYALLYARDAAMAHLVSEAGEGQYYRLRTAAFSTPKYMTIVNKEMQGIKVIDLNDTHTGQVFKFLARTDDANAGKFEIGNMRDNDVVKLNTWNTAMAGTKGQGVPFTITYIGNDLFTITQTVYTPQGPYFAPAELQTDGTAIVFSDQRENSGRNNWILEPVSATEQSILENFSTLEAAINLANSYQGAYDADKDGLPGYLNSAGKTAADNVDYYLQAAQQILNSADKETDASILTGAAESLIGYVNTLRETLAVISYPTNRYFSIKNAGTDNRGYLIYEPDATKTPSGGNYVWTTGKTDATPFSANKANHLWCFLSNVKNGKTEYYLYNAGLKKFAQPTKGEKLTEGNGYSEYHWIFTDEPAAITFIRISDQSNNHNVRIIAKSNEDANGTEVALSVSNEYTGPAISYYEANDQGVPFICEWGDLDFDAATQTKVQDYISNNVTMTTKKATDKLISGLDNGMTISTYSSDKAFALREGVTAYIAKTTDIQGVYKLSRVEGDKVIPAGTGVILVGSEGVTNTTIDIIHRDADLADVTGNVLQASGSGTITMEDGDYILARTDDQGIGFYPALLNSTLKAHKAFIRTGGVRGVNALRLFFGDNDVTTGLNHTMFLDENTPLYDLSGRRVQNTAKGGLYIKGGKKLYIK